MLFWLGSKMQFSFFSILNEIFEALQLFVRTSFRMKKKGFFVDMKKGHILQFSKEISSNQLTLTA